MVKVSGGARTMRRVGKHVDYIGREGELGVETDDEERLRGEGFEKALLKDWRLDLDAQQARALYSGTPGRKAPKLVHNIVLSMPAGTPPDKLLKAVRKFAQEQFALKHRYAMALHTDQGNPHVHLVVKVMSEQGERLNIRKATLREWRQEFARHLREQGIAANATERAVRGQTQASKLDGSTVPVRDGSRLIGATARSRWSGSSRTAISAQNPARPSCNRLDRTWKTVGGPRVRYSSARGNLRLPWRSIDSSSACYRLGRRSRR